MLLTNAYSVLFLGRSVVNNIYEKNKWEIKIKKNMFPQFYSSAGQLQIICMKKKNCTLKIE